MTTESGSSSRFTVEKPSRPQTWDQVGFQRRGPVQWFAPSVLARAAQRVAISSAFGDFLDKRELQGSLPPTIFQHLPEGPDTWIDFIADTGDGFDPTYSIAWLAAQRSLTPAGATEALPRAGLVVFGGDEVYPVGSPDEYENRCIGPHAAALPYTGPPHPEVLAIPGNHDWYDGLTSFMRVFGQRKWIGGRKTVQERSYFAVRLPHNWWLLGIDIQFDTYIDEPQLRYFEAVAEQMGNGARVILSTAVPSWTDVETNIEGFRNLAYFETHILRRHGAELMVSLSGDSHHYARYESAYGTHKITAGGGGAFLHPTHMLVDPLNIPTDTTFENTERYRRRSAYPDARTSHRLSWGALALPVRNPTFMTIPAILYLVLGFASQFAVRTLKRQGDFDRALRDVGWRDVLATLTQPVSIVMLLVVLALLFGFAKPWAGALRGWRKTAAKGLMGATHLVLQIGLFIVVALAVVDISGALARGSAFFVLNAVLLGLAGAVAGSLALGLYLALWCRFGQAHGNEAFSAVSYGRAKNFLRMRIDGEGNLTIYAIGLDRANRQWDIDPVAGADDASWIKPTAEVAARLIEPPIRVGPPTATGAPPVSTTWLG